MLIQNYGLFWHIDRVHWGKARDRGTLNGYLVGAKLEGCVDFRKQRGIYVLYDENYEIIYVGQAGRGSQNLFPRLKQHRKDHLAERWSRFCWFGIVPVTEDWELDDEDEIEFDTDLPAVLNHIEAILIATAEPPLNLQRGRFGSDVEKYLQEQPVEED